jgi:putative heme-binding domain-containing protein
LDKLARLAEKDASPIVRLYVAAALQRMPLADRWPIAQQLVAHSEDDADHNLPKMLWFGIEPLVEKDAARALVLGAGSRIPVLTKYVARRASIAKESEAVADALTKTADLNAKLLLVEGLRDGLKSLDKREVKAPKNWETAAAALTATNDPKLREFVAQVGQLFGDANAVGAQLAALQNKATPVPQRREILQSFARATHAPALPVVLSLLDEEALRLDAIRALAAFDDPKVGQQLLGRYASMSPVHKAEVVLTLSGRRNTAQALVDSIKANRIPKSDVSAFAARQLYRVIGTSFVEFWGPITQLASDKEADTAKYKALLTDAYLAKADVSRGRAVFERSCTLCHMLYGSGGNVGPDLTGSNRANLDYILAQIINPSETMQEAYHLVVVTTRDGRTVSGMVAAEDEQQVTLRVIGQDTVIAKSEIQSREKLPISMMPEGLLKALSDEEVRDLIAYLRTTSQVPLPK